VVAACSDGQIVRRIPVGRWSLTIRQLNARGHDLGVDDQLVNDVVVSEDILYTVSDPST
jgi:hypothetical protein